MTEIPIPRIRARSGQGDDGKWYFEISMWNFEGTKMIGDKPLGTFGPWPDEKVCKAEMRKAVALAVGAIRGPNGESPSGVVDMLNGGTYRKIGSDH